MKCRQHDRREHETGPDRRCIEGNVHPASKARTAAGADSVRRRLSSIFQRPIAGIAQLRPVDLPTIGQRPKIHGSKLPVAARPAVVARGGDVVAGGNSSTTSISEARPARANMPSNRSWLSSVALRHPAGERGLERIDIVDALAGVGAFAEQILVNVGHGGSVGIDAAHAGEHALEQRAFTADRQRGRDARLQHGISFDDAAGSERRTADG